MAMTKNQEFSTNLQNVLKAINAVNKRMRCKKVCYDECGDEIIKKAFIYALEIDLIRLLNALYTWKINGFEMEKRK